MIAYRLDPRPSAQSLRALWLAVWGEPGPADFDAILSRSLAHVGVYDGERLIGFVNIASDGGIHASIFDTAVHPDYRRRGIGTGLVREAVRVAADRGALWLHVDFEPHLLEFYRRCGFRPTAAGLIDLRSPGEGLPAAGPSSA